MKLKKKFFLLHCLKKVQSSIDGMSVARYDNNLPRLTLLPF